MLTQEEVQRLEEVEKEYLLVCKEQVSVKDESGAYGKRYRKGLSAEEKREVNIAIEKVEDLEEKKDAFLSERNALYDKRAYRPNQDPHNKWDWEPGYGPSW